MTFGESVSICFRKYFVFQGRASLSEFWWFQLIWVLAYLSIMIFSDNDPIVFFFLGIIISIALPLVAVSIRRLHDTNKSGLYILWNFIPFIGVFPGTESNFPGIKSPNTPANLDSPKYPICVTL